MPTSLIFLIMTIGHAYLVMGVIMQIRLPPRPPRGYANDPSLPGITHNARDLWPQEPEIGHPEKKII